MPIIGLSTLCFALFSGCARTPPDYRSEVSVPVYSEGDAERGQVIFEEACSQCHQLNPGLNKKGPQLMNIYGAKSAQLADFDYSDGLKAAGWEWTAEKLDPYIEDNEKIITDSKMLADPMPDASERADVIAYLSTLRAPVPALDAEGFPIDSKTTTKANIEVNNKVNANVSSTTDDADTDSVKSAATSKAGQSKPLRDEAIEISEGAENKPAADFQ